MFHLLLGLPMLIIAFLLLGAIISAALFGLFAFIASVIGGAWLNYLLKDKLAKRLVFAGFSTTSFIGLLFVIPVSAAFLGVSPDSFIAIIGVMLMIIAILGAIGLKLSLKIGSKYAKIAVSACFITVLILAVFLEILVLITLF